MNEEKNYPQRQSSVALVAQQSGVDKLTFTEEQRELIKKTICRGATDDEFALFLYVCQRTGRDPFRRQIYAVKRYDSNLQQEVMAIQMGIDHFRITAEESRQYAGQVGPYWCGRDGQWVEVWTNDEPPFAAKVGVKRKDWAEPMWGLARYAAYVQTKRDGSPNQFWKRMPDFMLAKCAEAQAIRKAFPEVLGGIYIPEEMVDEPREVEVEPPTGAPPPKTLTELAERERKPNGREPDLQAVAPPMDDRPDPAATQAAAEAKKPAPVPVKTIEKKVRIVCGVPVDEMALPWDVVKTRTTGAKAQFLANKTWGEVAADPSLRPLLSELCERGQRAAEKGQSVHAQFQCAALALEAVNLALDAELADGPV